MATFIIIKKNYLEKEKFISRVFFLNYEVIFDTSQDTKGYLQNLSVREVVLYNCKYFNE